MTSGVYKRTEETKRKMSQNHSHFWLGKKQSEEHKRKISKSLIGNTRSLGYKQSKENIRKSRETRRKNGWWKNPNITKKKQSESKIGRKRPPFSEEWIKNISEASKGKRVGEKNPNWQGGKSFELYTVDWTETLRGSIRERDNYTCQLCNQYGNAVHHIDYNKKNCNPDNLITLCRRCNAKVNYKRNYWINYFWNIMDKERNFKGKFITIDSKIQ